MRGRSFGGGYARGANSCARLHAAAFEAALGVVPAFAHGDEDDAALFAEDAETAEMGARLQVRACHP